MEPLHTIITKKHFRGHIALLLLVMMVSHVAQFLYQHNDSNFFDNNRHGTQLITDALATTSIQNLPQKYELQGHIPTQLRVKHATNNERTHILGEAYLTFDILKIRGPNFLSYFGKIHPKVFA